MRILMTEKIVWKFQEPEKFPCFVCRDRKAINRTTVQHRDITMIVSCCDECNNYDDLRGFLVRERVTGKEGV